MVLRHLNWILSFPICFCLLRSTVSSAPPFCAGTWFTPVFCTCCYDQIVPSVNFFLPPTPTALAFLQPPKSLSFFIPSHPLLSPFSSPASTHALVFVSGLVKSWFSFYSLHAHPSHGSCLGEKYSQILSHCEWLSTSLECKVSDFQITAQEGGKISHKKAYYTLKRWRS